MSRRTKTDNVTPITTRQGVVRNTGEVVDVDFPAQRGRRRKTRRKMFALMDLEALADLEVTGAQWQVLTHVMKHVNPETNEAHVTGKQLAQEIGIDQSNVSRALTEMQRRRIITSWGRGHHRVNPHIMFRGSNQDWDEATETSPEPIWRRS